MRLLWVLNNPVFGGAHNQLLQLIEPLSRRGVETLTLLPDEPASGLERMRAAGADVITTPLHRLRATADPRVQARFAASFGREVAAVREIVRDRDVDVVQPHGPTNPHGAIAAHREGRAVLWQIYDTRAPMLLRRLAMPMVVRLADAITTWGEALAREHPGALSLGERCIAVYGPVDSERFAPDPARRAPARLDLGAREDDVVIGNLAMFNPSKGHEYLVRAAEILRREHPEAIFRVMGASSPAHASYESAVLDEARRRGLGDPRILDFFDAGSRVPDLIQGLDVFVMTSVPRSEGMPTAILEAMTRGLPVVATDVGAVRELVDDGGTGFVVPPEDPPATAGALARLVEDPALRARMGEAGRKRALECFGIERLADLHLHAIELAMEHRAGRTGRAAKPPELRGQLPAARDG